ncbi:MAG TPA: hypothetical protein VNX68_07075 [Nitrosopumilaceae archaeon]|nr:hypothetical protein [Nitrosopumilaceae archaeon]
MSSDSNVQDDSLAEAVKSMEDLVNEAVQVYELDKEKTNVIDDLYNSLKVITNFLGFSIDLNPALLNLAPETRALLTPTLDIFITKPNFKCEQKRFDQLTLDETANILRYAIPTIINMAKSDRLHKDKKIATLRAATKKLQRLPYSNMESVVTDTSIHIGEVER